MTQNNNSRMIGLVARGDSGALGEIVSEYKDRLVNYFYSTLGDRHAAEDLAQEVFVRVFRKAESFRDGMPFEPWLFAIARNLVVDHLRKTKRREQAHTEMREEVTPGDTMAEPSRALEKNELGEKVRAEIHRMPEKLRSAIVLCELEGFSYETAANILGIKPKALGSRLARARDHLRNAFRNYRF